MMQLLTILRPVGRVLFGLALAGIGMEHFVAGHFPQGLVPMAPLGIGQLVAVYAAGAVLGLGGSCLLAGRAQRPAGYALALLFAILLLTAHLPRLLANPADASEWTGALELVALGSGGLLLASQCPGKQTARRVDERAGLAGHWLLALALAGFGLLHFLYASFIATLIPTWIPFPLFWAYFVGVAFGATALSLLLGWQRPLGTGLLGGMFCLWVLVLHGPRVAASPRVEAEWTSAFVALALGGILWSIAGLAPAARRAQEVGVPAPASNQASPG